MSTQKTKFVYEKIGDTDVFRNAFLCEFFEALFTEAKISVPLCKTRAANFNYSTSLIFLDFHRIFLL